jgi:hypothetical protein
MDSKNKMQEKLSGFRTQSVTAQSTQHIPDLILIRTRDFTFPQCNKSLVATKEK